MRDDMEKKAKKQVLLKKNKRKIADHQTLFAKNEWQETFDAINCQPDQPLRGHQIGIR